MLQVPDPDMIPDWVKVFVSATAAAASTLLAVLKLVKEPLVKDINGQGDRITEVERDQVALNTRLDGFERSMSSLQRDMLEAIHESGNQTLSAIGELKTEIVRFDERLKIQKVVDDAVDRALKRKEV